MRSLAFIQLFSWLGANLMKSVRGQRLKASSSNLALKLRPFKATF